MKKIKQELLQVCGQDREEKKVDGTSLSSSSFSSLSTTFSQNQKCRCLYIIPIVGMGGMGKTTLARNVLNDDEMKGLFDLRVRVCVSENFEKSSILKRIIDTIDTNCYYEMKEKSFQELEDELHKLVQGKKVLLVLDNIWNEERVEWEWLVTLLQEAAQNSRGCAILITSRIRNIKDAIPGCMEAIRLEGLREDDLWPIFERYAFCDDSTDLDRVDRERVESIGKDILKKLKGSPLAAKSIGTLLASNHSTEHWKDVAGSELWKVSSRQFDIISILTLSYRYLDAHLKNFLIYFLLFPRDYEFKELEIVQLWMAHNSFQHQENTQEVLEDAGREYLKHLVGRCFLEYNDGMYTMHDLIHDTIQSVSAHDCCLLERGSDIRNEVAAAMGVQHLSVCCDDGVQYVYENASKYKKLRTLMISWSLQVEFSKITHMTCLKVLVLKDCGMKELPESVGSLKHLRLLDLSKNILLKKLPESIGLLHNLLVLNVEGCSVLKCLPSTMPRLVNLRHLHCDEGIVVKGIGRLVSLRSDLCFSVRQESGFYIDELKCLNELHGSLEIRNLDLVRSQEDAEAAHIGNKTHLQKLSLCWSDDDRNKDSLPWETVAREEEVLEALKPCQAIKKIVIGSYGGPKPPSWLNDTWLVSLKSIELLDINMENLPPSLSKMPFLEAFFIRGAPKLKYMRLHMQAQPGVSDSSVAAAFPMLEELRLEDMPAFEGFQIEEEAVGKPPISVILPKLKSLILDSCPYLKEWFPIQAPVLEKLTINSVPQCLVSHLQTYPHLKELLITDIQGMDNELLASVLSSGLTSLSVRRCRNITSCDLSALTSLKMVYIFGCGNITACCLPPAPAALQDLSIISCHRMAAVSLSSPPLSIDDVGIFFCPNLLYFGTNPSTDDQSSSFSWSSNRPEPGIYYCPRRLRIFVCTREQLSRLLHAIYYTNLESLYIGKCSDIEHFNDDDDGLQLSTAMLQLTSLKDLLIHDCDKLQSLPPDIGSKLLRLERIRLLSCPLLSSLPDLHPLPSLRALQVTGCPQLENSPDVDLLISSKNLSRYVDL